MKELANGLAAVGIGLILFPIVDRVVNGTLRYKSERYLAHKPQKPPKLKFVK